MKNLHNNTMNGSIRVLRNSVLVILVAMSVQVSSFGQEIFSDQIPQYLFSKFSQGIVVKKDGTKVGASLNYNIVTEEMVFLENERYLALSNISVLDTVFLNGMVFLPQEKAFYELAYDGALRLLVQFSATVKVEGDDIGYGITSQTSNVTNLSSLTNSGILYNMDLPPNIRVTRTVTFYAEKDGKLNRFVTKKAFLRIFKEHRNELEPFIEKEGTDFTVYDDVVKLFEYTDSLYR